MFVPLSTKPRVPEIMAERAQRSKRGEKHAAEELAPYTMGWRVLGPALFLVSDLMPQPCMRTLIVGCQVLPPRLRESRS